MKASVIIPTRNRAATLDRCLTSLLRQNLSRDHFEILVVDNGSTDNTPQIANQFASALPLRVISEPQPGLHAGRHAGMRSAQSDVLVFADDDIQAQPTWLESIVRAFEDPAVVMVGGNNVPLFETPPPEWLTRWWHTPNSKGRALPFLSILDYGHGAFDVNPHFIWGCNFSIRRATLKATGGFHPDSLPSDRLRWRGDGETWVSEWVLRAGLRARFDSGASVHHLVPQSRMTRDYFKRRAYAQGISDSYTDIRRTGAITIPARRRLARWISTRLRFAKLKLTLSADAARSEMLSIKLDVLRAWQDGYEYHQTEVGHDPALLEWVTKESYM